MLCNNASDRKSDFRAELSHNRDRRNAPRWAQNRSESLCAGSWVPCRICWAWFGPALGPNPARKRRFPTRSSKVFGALVAQPRESLGGCRLPRPPALPMGNSHPPDPPRWGGQPPPKTPWGEGGGAGRQPHLANQPRFRRVGPPGGMAKLGPGSVADWGGQRFINRGDFAN
jgi:hypothetical protein